MAARDGRAGSRGDRRPEGVADDDVDDILARAAGLQAEAEARAGADDGRASIDEVKAVARELAIDPAHVDAAIRAHRAERTAAERQQEDRRATRARWLLRGGVAAASAVTLSLLALGCSGLLSWMRAPEAPVSEGPRADHAGTTTTPVLQRSVPEGVAPPVQDPHPEPAGAPTGAETPTREPPVTPTPDIIPRAAPPPIPAARRVPLAPADALTLRRELEGAWDLRAYMLRDEGRWVGVPVTRAQERWLLRRAGDFEHTMGDPIAFSGRWTVTETIEGFPAPWEDARVFLLALTDVRALALDMERPLDWHVGVLSEGDLALFYAGAGPAPDIDGITQGTRFARGAR